MPPISAPTTAGLPGRAGAVALREPQATAAKLLGPHLGSPRPHASSGASLASDRAPRFAYRQSVRHHHPRSPQLLRSAQGALRMPRLALLPDLQTRPPCACADCDGHRVRCGGSAARQRRPPGRQRSREMARPPPRRRQVNLEPLVRRPSRYLAVEEAATKEEGAQPEGRTTRARAAIARATIF